MSTQAQPNRPHVGKRWYRSVTISLSAFVMSATATFISAFHALRGPEIEVRPPKQIVIYTNKTGLAPVSTMVLSIDIINDSPDHGDVLLDSSLRLGDADAIYPSNGTARFAPGADMGKCSFGASCAPVLGFLIETTQDTLIELPKGSARTITLSFPVDADSCSGRRCSDFATSDKLMSAMSSGSVVFKVQLDFHGDGNRTVVCATRRLDMSYLRRNGLTSTSCETASISDPPVL